MKKWMVAMTMATMMVGGFTVFAAEAETAVVSNITKEDFLARRAQQINEALEAGNITQEQANLLLERSKERAEEGTFGYGRRGDGNAECVLGEDGPMGLFRNENARQRPQNGQGNAWGGRGNCRNN